MDHFLLDANGLRDTKRVGQIVSVLPLSTRTCETLHSNHTSMNMAGFPDHKNPVSRSLSITIIGWTAPVRCSQRALILFSLELTLPYQSMARSLALPYGIVHTYDPRKEKR